MCFGMEGWSCHGWEGEDGMGWEMLDGRMIGKDGGGERECIVKSHGRHYGKRRICFFPRRKPSGKERGREMIDSSSMSCFGQHRRKFCAMVV